MYRFLLVLALLFSANFAFSETTPEQKKVTESAKVMASPNDSIISDSSTIEDTSIVQQEAKSGKSEKDDVDKDSLGYKIGYQIGSWLIPGILMILVTIMIARRARRGRDENPGL